jgi:alginate O-acetyltransferase complex protein AlgI
MEFTSYSYLIFLTLSVLVARVATRPIVRDYVLLALSFVFYATWDARYLVVLLAIGIFTFLAGKWVARSRGKLSVLAVPVAAILLVLAGFKYTALAVEALNLGLPVSNKLTVPSIVLPLGISFFTFECISYLLDVYKGAQQLTPLRRFLLFPAFWPHMVAGPILRLKEFAPQLEQVRRATLPESLQALDRILLGWVKKLVFANTLAGVVDQGFANGSVSNSSVDNWLVAVAFGLQIYFDFSAYSDIAIGSAKLVGIDFPENFNLPYHARSPTEFWTRWHMTLSRWIRDYLFFPLNIWAGKRLWLRYVLLVSVMALVGLWHGAGLCFVLWGAWHGLLMVSHRLVEKRIPDWVPGWARSGCGLLLTFSSVQAGWILFRSPDIAQAARMLQSLVVPRGLSISFGINDCLLVAVSLVTYFVAEPALRPLLTRNPNDVDYSRWTFWLRPVVYALSLQCIFMFDRSNVAFIYFQF